MKTLKLRMMEESKDGGLAVIGFGTVMPKRILERCGAKSCEAWSDSMRNRQDDESYAAADEPTLDAGAREASFTLWIFLTASGVTLEKDGGPDDEAHRIDDG